MGKIAATKPTVVKAKSVNKFKSGGGAKGTADMRILLALAKKKALGEEVVDRKEVQTLAGIANESSFKVTAGKMRTKGWIDYPCNKTLSIMDAGMEKLGPDHKVDIPTTNEQVHEGIVELIKQKKSKEIFYYLTDGSTRSKAEIAKAIGYEENAPSFKTYIGAVSKYMEKLDNKMFRLQDKYFPFGRPAADGGNGN